MPRPRSAAARPRRSGAFLASLALHGLVVVLGPSLAYLALGTPAPRRIEVTLAERAQVEPAPAEEAREPEQLEFPELPEEPALAEVELDPLPLLPLEASAHGAPAALALPFEPRWNALHWGPRRGRADGSSAGPGEQGGELAGEPAAPTPPGAPAVPAAGGGDEPTGKVAVAKSCPTPDYPPLSRSRGEEGVVLLRLSIDDHGIVSHAEIVESSGFRRLDAAAVAGVRSWRFEPAVESGEPIESELLWRVVFRLGAA